MRELFRGLVLAGALGGLAGCSRPAAAPAEGAKEPPAVTLVAPAPATVTRAVEQPGAVLPFEEAHLHAKLPGFVAMVRADIGKAVEAGEVLAELDIPELDEEAGQKSALIGKAVAEVELARKGKAAAAATLGAYRALVAEAKAGLARTQALVDRWDSESRRMAGLVERGVVDQGSGDEARNQAKASASAREEARARVGSADASVLRYEAEVARAEAEVASALARLEVARADARRTEKLRGYKAIPAPFAGVVTARNVHPGDFVQPGTAGGMGLFTVARLDPVRVVIQVPEGDAPLVHDGQQVKLTLPALRPPEHEGRVSRTSWALDPRARTLRAEIDLPNGKGVYRPGLYVLARLSAKLPAAWTLPPQAVVKQGDELVAFRVAEGKAVRTPVRVGARDAQRVEILGQRTGTALAWEALTGGESFIAAIPPGLADGQPVAVGR